MIDFNDDFFKKRQVRVSFNKDTTLNTLGNNEISNNILKSKNNEQIRNIHPLVNLDLTKPLVFLSNKEFFNKNTISKKDFNQLD
jgi:hypothetical protein